MQGTIKKKTERGFGFILQDGSDAELFFHANDLQGISFDELQEGTAVTFEVENGQKGPAAKNVQVAGADNEVVTEEVATEEESTDTETTVEDTQE